MFEKLGKHIFLLTELEDICQTISVQPFNAILCQNILTIIASYYVSVSIVIK